MWDVIIVVLLIVLIFQHPSLYCKPPKDERMDTDPGGFSKYAGVATSPFYEYDDTPKYGRFA